MRPFPYSMMDDSSSPEEVFKRYDGGKTEKGSGETRDAAKI
jgi:hypothetical protein